MKPQFMPQLVRSQSLDLKDYMRRMEALENSVLTIKEACELTGLHKTSIQRAIDTGRLIAAKKDAEHGKRGGVWLIERKSIFEEWGEILHERGHNE